MPRTRERRTRHTKRRSGDPGGGGLAPSVANTGQWDFVPHTDINRAMRAGCQNGQCDGMTQHQTLHAKSFHRAPISQPRAAKMIDRIGHCPESRKPERRRVKVQRPYCADRRAGQGGRKGGLAWCHCHFRYTQADLHAPDPDRNNHLPTASEARVALLAIIDLQGGRDLSRCTINRSPRRTQKK